MKTIEEKTLDAVKRFYGEDRNVSKMYVENGKVYVHTRADYEEMVCTSGVPIVYVRDQYGED